MKNSKLGQYEIMDRIYIILESIDSNILNHSEIIKKQTKKVSAAMSLLSDVYQIAGTLSIGELD